MDFTTEIAKSYNTTPFEILKQDKDEVIMLINYFIEKGDSEEVPTNTKTKKASKETRIKVNDATASGGWF